MKTYQQQFIDLALGCQALQFGSFTLKSGRISPYFFNAAQFDNGYSLHKLASCYAACIKESGLDFEVLFGPAYKGIILAATVAEALYRDYGICVDYAFNRKETKAHGEGGAVVGAALAGRRVMIIDDVITAGTAVSASMALLQAEKARVVGLVLALDRQEYGRSSWCSATGEIQKQYGITVLNIVGLTDISRYAAEHPAFTESAEALESYRRQYGVGN